MYRVAHYSTVSPSNNEIIISPQQSTKFSSPDHEDDYQIALGDEIVENNSADGDEYKSASSSKISFKKRAQGIRQHVNPLSRKYQASLNLSKDWLSEGFQNVSNPLHIDIGCAKGSWVLKYGQSEPQLNILGLEIRRPMTDLCLHRKKVWQLTNVHFLSSNANVDLTTILASIEEQNVSIRGVSIQFPDPHFKNRHHKRRLVTTDLVSTIAKHLKVNSFVFVQSDVLDIMQYMVRHFMSSPYFSVADIHDPNNLDKNQSPFPVQTEREISTLAKGMNVYRLLFYRNGKQHQE